MIWGYARVSTQEQQLHLQLDALRAYGCQEVVKEKASALKERPALRELLDQVQPGDTVVVWKLDRLGRSLKHLVELVLRFQEKQIQFVSLQDHMDTTTAQGRLMFNLFASLAEFERDLIRERTQAGLAAARARGRQGGRPPGLSKEAQRKAEAVKTLYLQKDKTAEEIGQLLGLGRSTVYRYLGLLGVRTDSTASIS
ncbi:recombinase family protein [Hymenobacter sp. HD11105]